VNFFSEKQSKFLGFVGCCSGAVILASLATLLVYLLNLAINLFGGVFWSLAISGMMAILLRPVVSFFEEKIRMSRISAILSLYLLVLILFSFLFWFFGGKILRQTKDLIGSAGEWPTKLEEKAKENLPPDIWEGVSDHADAIKKYWNNILGSSDLSPIDFLNPEHKIIISQLSETDKKIWLELDEEDRASFFSHENNASRSNFLQRKNLEMRNRVVESIGSQGEQIAQKSAEVLKSAWSGLGDLFAKIAYLAIIPIYLFYFLSSNRNLLDELEKELNFLSDSIREDVIFLIREFVGIMVAFFRGQLLIGIMMGVGYAIGFSLSGLKFGITLGLFFGLLNIVPYLGSIVGISSALVIAYLQPDGIAESGQWSILLGCGITFLIVQIVESYYLTPKIMGQKTGLHPVVVIVSIFFWGTALGGILGMIFGIPLTAFIIILWRLLCRKYFAKSFC
jgi:predicted PurR-regulated permease PerM